MLLAAGNHCGWWRVPDPHHDPRFTTHRCSMSWWRRYAMALDLFPDNHPVVDPAPMPAEHRMREAEPAVLGMRCQSRSAANTAVLMGQAT